MSPRPGGEADKFGSRYEGAWTVSHVLHVLAGTGRAIVVEKAGELDDGAEFLYTRDNDGVVEAHQLKRQTSSANSWSTKALLAEHIWANAKKHIDAGREFHFVSTVPAVSLAELADRARRSADLADFVKNWLTNDKLRTTFDELSAADIYGSPDAAWTMLRGMWFRCEDERGVVNMNTSISGVLLDGAGGELAALGLGDMIVNQLGAELTAATIESQLAKYRLKLASADQRKSLRTAVDHVTSNWRAAVGRELLQPTIKRPEAGTLAGKATAPTSAVTFLVGAAGGGKSAVLSEAVEQLLTDTIPVLAFRLDRVADFDSTEDLGTKLGLGVSPVSALAVASSGDPCVLVVDQLDAVSLASGRMPTSFNAVEDLVREAAAFPLMQVVLACRQFDVENDYRIRTLQSQLKADSVGVPALSVEKVHEAVSAMGLHDTKLQPKQEQLLQLPLHLVLLAGVADQPEALDFQSTAHLFDAYWRRKRQAINQRKPGVRFSEVITTVANAISDRQRLSVPDTVLDAGDLGDDAEVLISEHVLVRDGNQIAFFHEAFFDYAFARQWATRSQTLVEFLTAGEQELFRRAQVRQILHHLRERDFDRYLTELKATLVNPDVRFHIEEAILAVLTSLSDPTSEELQIALDAGATDPDLGGRVWRMLRSPAWFGRLDSDGKLEGWLEHGTTDGQNRAVDILATAARSNPTRVAEILAPLKGQAEYNNRLLWITGFAELYAGRELFDLLLDAVRAGAADGRENELWLASHNLADHEPSWAIELLKAYFVERPNSFAPDGAGKVADLTQREHALADMIRKAASAAPEIFVDTLLPYMTRVMAATSSQKDTAGLPTDRHFSYHYDLMAETSEADHAFLVGMRSAVAAVVRADPVAARPTLEALAATELSGAQSLLYLGLIAGGAHYADWSASLILEGPDRLLCGNMSNSVWVTRELIQAIAPHIDDATHQAIEDVVRDLRFDWEKQRDDGDAFALLSALDSKRLTELGRRRLGEYQRKFGTDHPPTPEGVTGGSIESPISGAAVGRMTDKNWLQALAKHDEDRTNWTTFKGGARELSYVLQQQTKENPTRFARLALQLTAEMNQSYPSAILLGLGDAERVSSEEEEIVYDAVRHIAGLGIPDTDRWIGRALRRYLKAAPIDLVELVRDRAIEATDPVGDRDDTSTGREPGERLRFAGINSARGSLAEELGNLLVYDVDGSRTAAVLPVLEELATDPVVAVRAQAAHPVGAALRFARPEAVAAFVKLVDTSDEVLVGQFVRRLMMYIGNGGDQAVVLPVIQRMVDSDLADVRQCGGELALVAAIDWEERAPLDQIMAGSDVSRRKGVAEAAAARLGSNRNASLAAGTLSTLFNDADPAVREAAAGVAANLRNEPLVPYEPVLTDLINSPSFEPATPQIFLTLQAAPDRVDTLALRSAQRFIEVFGSAAGDIRTDAAGDAHYVCDLVIRGLAQAQTVDERAALLDVIDALVRVGVYGIDEAVDNAER